MVGSCSFNLWHLTDFLVKFLPSSKLNQMSIFYPSPIITFHSVGRFVTFKLCSSWMYSHQDMKHLICSNVFCSFLFCQCNHVFISIFGRNIKRECAVEGIFLIATSVNISSDFLQSLVYLKCVNLIPWVSFYIWSTWTFFFSCVNGCNILSVLICTYTFGDILLWLLVLPSTQCTV